MMHRATLTAVAVLCVIAASLAAVRVDAQYDAHTSTGGVYYVKPVYCNHEKLRTWTCGPACDYHPGVTNITVINHDLSDSLCYVAYNPADNVIVVSCRGSSNILNWIEDFDFILVPFPANCSGCKVHQGFYYSYLAMRERILAAVTNLGAEYPNANIFVTGHSLGASQAVFALYDVLLYVPTTGWKRMYNYGQPRVGDPKFAAFIDLVAFPQHAHYRLTHDMDPVPHLPPTFAGYLHSPREVWYKQGINALGFKVCNDTAYAEDPTCSDSVLPIDPTDHEWYMGINMGCGDSNKSDLPSDWLKQPRRGDRQRETAQERRERNRRMAEGWLSQAGIQI